MALKRVFAPHLNREIILGGCKPIKFLGPHLTAESYLRAVLPAPPGSCNYSPKAMAALSQVFLNNDLGDCVIAEGYHMVGVETGNVGKIFIATNEQILHDYSQIGGYIPGNPATDDGCDPVTALNWWVAHGFADGTKPLGWLTNNATNKTTTMQCMDLFENLDICISLPDAWISPFPNKSGFVWDVAGNPDPNNGHCIAGIGYNSQGVLIDTWGLIGTITWAAIEKYCVLSAGGQLFTMLTPDQVAKAHTVAPNGVSWSNLIADFNTLGGHVQEPAPTPVTPPPTPSPAPSSLIVSLDQATTWANQGLGGLPPLMLRSQAERAVAQALSKNWPKQTN
jgi:hypothetical protein